MAGAAGAEELLPELLSASRGLGAGGVTFFSLEALKFWMAEKSMTEGALCDVGALVESCAPVAYYWAQMKWAQAQRWRRVKMGALAQVGAALVGVF